LANSTDNNLNWISAKYGITLLQSPYLGAAASGGSATRWFLLGAKHSNYRFTRIPMETKLIPPENEANGDTVYRGRFREVLGAIDYQSTVGYET